MGKNDDKIRAVTMITMKEKEWLKHLAWKSGRSMAGYLRYLLNEVSSTIGISGSPLPTWMVAAPRLFNHG